LLLNVETANLVASFVFLLSTSVTKKLTWFYYRQA